MAAYTYPTSNYKDNTDKLFPMGAGVMQQTIASSFEGSL